MPRYNKDATYADLCKFVSGVSIADYAK
jgi:hypothetical protein